MYVRGIADYNLSNKPGKFATVLYCKGKRKTITGTKENTTGNKMIILGIKEGVEALNKPSIINIYTHANVGIAQLERGKFNGDNRAELIDLAFLVKKNKHILKFHITNDYQNDLKKILYNI